ncbi:MAG: pentapeptide MXKDX repeat protein [Terriglobales bacterium]
MNKMIRRLMAMCLLAVSFSAFAPSGDAMKQDDSMKQGDSMKKDEMKKDEMKKDKMKKDKKSKKKAKKGDWFLRSLGIATANNVMRDRFSSTCQRSRQTTS